MSNIDVIKLRAMLGLTQQKFAERIGVNRRTVVNWESGSKIPDSKLKLFQDIIYEEGKQKRTAPLNIHSEEKNISSTDLTREILELKDHIKTLKEFLDEKTTIADIYKEEILKLKEEIEVFKKQ